MKFLIRSFIFLSLLCSFAFSNACSGGLCSVIRDKDFDSTFKPIDGKFLKGNNYYGLRSPETGYYYIYSFTITQEAYYFLGSKTPGFYVGFGYGHVYIGGERRVGRFGQRGGGGIFDYFVFSDYPKDPVFNYYDFIVFNSKEVARCKLNQEFNTDTMQCVDSCPAGQLWNVKSNSCVVDCTDEDNHKFFTSDYNCIDCSSALTIDDVARCYCTGLGSSYNPGYAWDPNKPNIVQAHCKDGSEIVFKFDKNKENLDKEKEDKDKDKEDPNKDKDKDKEDPNKDKDKEDPSKDKEKDKDNNNSKPGTGGGSSGGNNNGSSGNNSGSSGGTGGGSGGGNGGGSSGGGQGNNGNSENATPGNIDYGDLEEKTGNLSNMYKKNIDDLFEPIDGIKKSLNDTISKIKDGDLMSLKKRRYS
ncbi:hypothetical protein [Campylobacter concisus]|uniref:hypothetical protein n=1 Tax=Campylobacter concisus TaxID=199 RepID=UPI000CD82CC2|nr:hypothetical protein [Campylobacter concisus]